MRALVSPWVALAGALGEETVREIGDITQADWGHAAGETEEGAEDAWTAVLARAWRDSVGPLGAAL